jgi:hypothetical protein
MSKRSPAPAGDVRRRGVDRAAERRHDRPDPAPRGALGVGRLALAAAGRPAIAIPLVTPVAIAVAVSWGWF